MTDLKPLNKNEHKYGKERFHQEIPTALVIKKFNDSLALNKAENKATQISGNDFKGIMKRFANSLTGELAYPKKLTEMDQSGVIHKLRKFIGGDNTIQNSADIEKYNTKPFFNHNSLTHGSFFTATEVATAVVAGLSLLARPNNLLIPTTPTKDIEKVSIAKNIDNKQINPPPNELVNDIAEYTGKSSDNIKKEYEKLESLGINYQHYLGEYVNNNSHGITKKDAHYIFAYTNNFFYKKLNLELREGTLTSEAGKRIVSNITKALDKLPDVPGSYYRGLKNLSPEKANSIDHLYSIGNTVDEKQFNSLGKKLIPDYLTGESRALQFTMEGRVKDISDMSVNRFADVFGNQPLEKEFIMMPNTSNLVLDKKNNVILCKECNK